MIKQKDTSMPAHFLLAAKLSGGLTIAISGIYILLSLAAIIFRFNCYAGTTTNLRGSDYFWHTIFRVYILKSEDCSYTVSIPANLTGEYTIFVLNVLILCTSVLCLASAILLIAAAEQEEVYSRYMYAIVFSYIGCCTAALIVDLTAASHLGIDYVYMSDGLRSLTYGSTSSYETEVIRQGAMVLMAIVMKGYLAYAFALVLQILLVYYFLDYKRQVKNDHPIHKLGVLTAYDQPRRPDEWSQSDQFSPYNRGPVVNNAFVNDDDNNRNNRLDPHRYNDYPSRPVNRAESWRDQNLSQSARPFSYLDDVKRPSPRPPPSPVVESPWRRDPPVESPWKREPQVESPWKREPQVESPWKREAPVETPWRRDAPHVPAPDYSPNAPRRLKSALKSGYM